MTRIERFGWRGAVEPGIGRVVSAHGDYYHLVCNEAEGEILARKKKSAFGRMKTVAPDDMKGAKKSELQASEPLKPITGDFVRFRHNAQGDSMIFEVLPRFSHFERRDPAARRTSQTLAVNFDTLFIMMSLNEDFSTARIDRYLALAEDIGEGEAVVVLTKADLWRDGDEAFVDELVETIAGRARLLKVSRREGVCGSRQDSCFCRLVRRRQVDAPQYARGRGVGGYARDSGVVREGPPHDDEPRARHAAVGGDGDRHARRHGDRHGWRDRPGSGQGRLDPPLEKVMKTRQFWYPLPERLIAQHPAEKRGTEKMMVLHRATGVVEHLLVVNDTKVFPARLIGEWPDTHGAIELLMVNAAPMDADDERPSMTAGTDSLRWNCIIGSGRKCREGQVASFGPKGELKATLVKPLSGIGMWQVEFSCDRPLMDLLDEFGRTPVPPYVKREGTAEEEKEDRERDFRRA